MKCCAGGTLHPSLVCGCARSQGWLWSSQGRFVTAAAEAAHWVCDRRCQTEGEEPPGTGQDGYSPGCQASSTSLIREREKLAPHGSDSICHQRASGWRSEHLHRQKCGLIFSFKDLLLKFGRNPALMWIPDRLGMMPGDAKRGREHLGRWAVKGTPGEKHKITESQNGLGSP